jgi:hypothetical protein
MALLTAVSVTSVATTVTPNAVTSSDTISQSDIGTDGALLNIINGSGSSMTVTISDPGLTGVGNAGTPSAQTVGAGADRWFRISPGHVGPAGVATITNSATTTITYKLIRC